MNTVRRYITHSIGGIHIKITEYGDKGNPAVLLIHGMGCTGTQSFGVTIELLKDKYRIILPLLDGYDGENTTFSNIGDQARQIAAFLESRYAEGLYAALGMSMGGFIALELLLRYSVRVNRLILDSGYLNPMRCPRLISRFVAYGFGSLIRDRKSLIVRMAMRKVMGFCFRREDLCLTASFETIYNSELSCLTYDLPELPGRLAGANITYWYGQKEKFMIKGMRTIQKRLPQMREMSMGDVGHGEVMLTAPKKYAQLVSDALARNDA